MITGLAILGLFLAICLGLSFCDPPKMGYSFDPDKRELQIFVRLPDVSERPYHPTPFTRYILDRWWYILPLIMLGIYGWLLAAPDSAMRNIGPELFGIAVGVIIIDFSNQQRQDKQLKAQLIREMASSENGFALRAIKELRVRGWLQDGSLNGSDFRGADLRGAHLGGAVLRETTFFGANLSEANLWGTDFTNANLDYAVMQGVDLSYASLEGAILPCVDLKGSNFWETNLNGVCIIGSDLTEVRIMSETLCQVDELYGTILPDGKKYSGFYNLETNILSAKEEGIDVNDPYAMAKFYKVSVEDYLQGQEWAALSAEEQCSIRPYEEIQPTVIIHTFFGKLS